MLNNKSGFTLIELVMIIIILGILSAVAIPRYIDLKSDAEAASIKGIYGHIASAYGISVAQKKDFPLLSELKNNLKGDSGAVGVNAINQKTYDSLTVGANSIVGEKKTGFFSMLYTTISATNYITEISSITGL